MSYTKTDHERYLAAIDGLVRKGIIVYGPRLMILRDMEEEMTKGGLHIPDAHKKRRKSGTVIALGAGYEAAAKEEWAEGIVMGHRIAFNAYDGVEHSIDTSMGQMEVLSMHVGQAYFGWPNTGGSDDQVE